MSAGAGSREKVKTFGEGRAIFFLHGWQLSKELEIDDFEPAFADCAGWRRIYTDLPGMGARSDEGAEMKNFNALLDWVVEFIDARAPDEGFAVAGMSVGGQLARGVVERMPNRALGLLLRAPRLVADRKLRSIYDPDARTSPTWIAVTATPISTATTTACRCRRGFITRTRHATSRGLMPAGGRTSPF